ncbi:TPA: baseplate hub protein, partial [Klebsiella pneumoniae]
LISPEHGLIGYPIFYDMGINFRCIYSPSLKLNTKIILETDLPHASGEWIIQAGTTHYLSCKVPGGLWETFVVAAPGYLVKGDENAN